MLEGTLRGGVRPGTLAGQRLDATLGRAEHGVADLTTGVSDEQVELGSGGDVEHGSVGLYVASVEGKGEGVKPPSRDQRSDPGDLQA